MHRRPLHRFAVPPHFGEDGNGLIGDNSPASLQSCAGAATLHNSHARASQILLAHLRQSYRCAGPDQHGQDAFGGGAIVRA